VSPINQRKPPGTDRQDAPLPRYTNTNCS